MTARERLLQLLAADPRGSFLSIARINDVLLALEAAEEVCATARLDFGPVYETQQRAIERIRALREEVSK